MYFLTSLTPVVVAMVSKRILPVAFAFSLRSNSPSNVLTLTFSVSFGILAFAPEALTDCCLTKKKDRKVVDKNEATALSYSPGQTR